MRKVSAFDAVGSDQLVSGSDAAVLQGRLLDQRFDRVPQQRRVVRLAEQGEAQAAVHLPEDEHDREVTLFVEISFIYPKQQS